MAGATKSSGLWATLLLLGLSCAANAQDRPQPQDKPAGQVNTIREAVDWVVRCWRPPPRANPMGITVSVSFNRSGQILGKPKITYESAEATDNDRLEYRIA